MSNCLVNTLNKRAFLYGAKCYFSTSSIPQNVIKSNEETITSGIKDVYGPPDPKSNLRLINFHIPVDETEAEKAYRIERTKVQEWNQEFWTLHNQDFVKAKDEFTLNLLDKKKKEMRIESELVVSTDELSEFYKSFLDANRPRHVNYNKEWHKKNIQLLWPGVKAYFSRLKKQISNSH